MKAINLGLNPGMQNKIVERTQILGMSLNY